MEKRAWGRRVKVSFLIKGVTVSPLVAIGYANARRVKKISYDSLGGPRDLWLLKPPYAICAPAQGVFPVRSPT
jgi:hypothetical protein